MKSIVLPILLVSILSACGSADVSVNSSESSITVSSEARPSLTQLPDVNFNGQYETTAQVDAGDGDGLGRIEGVASVADSAASSDIVSGESTGGIIGTSPPVRPNQTIQPGTLTAGDYDDHLNPHQYQTYASEYLQRRGQWIDVPRVDFNNRIQVEVTNKAGLAIANAQVEVTGVSEVVTLRTSENGVVSLYSELDSLPENFTLKVTSADGTSAKQSINLVQALGAGKIEVALATTDQPNSTATAPIDLMFVVDTTGSMGDELNFLQTELTDIISAVTAQQSGMKIGLVFYRDYGDSYIVRAHEFSDDLNSVQLNLNQEAARGGGDYPEAMDQALQTAMGSQWRDNSRKVMFLIADAPPHSDRMRATWNAAEQARRNNIHIVPVAASGVAEDAEYIMRSVAALTESRYLFLTDDSGFGSQHAEPEVDCYVVTSLRTAMIRALNSLVTGTRVEPSANDIIRQAGNYDNGRCEQASLPTLPGNIDNTVLVDQQAPQNGTFTEKQIATITNQSALDQALAQYGEASTSVDFNAGKVLLIDMGQKSSGGFFIELPSFEEFDDHVMANVVFNEPGRNCIVTTALSNPYMLVYVGTTKEIRLSETTKSTDCAG